MILHISYLQEHIGIAAEINKHHVKFDYDYEGDHCLLDMALCRLIDTGQRFRGTYCLHLQDIRTSHLKERGRTTLRNVGKFMSDYTTSYPRR
jgi:hypothetical protein